MICSCGKRLDEIDILFATSFQTRIDSHAGIMEY
jgi:hypothetical protein